MPQNDLKTIDKLLIFNFERVAEDGKLWGKEAKMS